MNGTHGTAGDVQAQAGATAPASARRLITEHGIDAALRTTLPRGVDDIYAAAKSMVAAWDLPAELPASVRPTAPAEYVPRPRLHSVRIDPLMRRQDECAPHGIPRPRDYPRRTFR